MSTERDLSKGELALIRRLRRELAAAPLPTPGPSGGEKPLVNFGDDMAAVEAGGQDLLWTADMLMDGTDFDSTQHNWYDIGRKAMAANLSDCAAMAAAPVAALAAVSLSNKLSMDDALALLRGARDCGARFGCPIVGGDTNSWDSPTAICVTVAARPEPGRRPVTRGGARPGDGIFLTGRVGGSILGRHMTFEPRVEAALEINRRLQPHALIDISDGLAIDLWRILDASNCGAIVDEIGLDAAIHPDAVRLANRDGSSPREHALHDGEDFELIVVLPPGSPPAECDRLGLLPIGRIAPGGGLMLRATDGSRTALECRGWEHFQ